MPNSKNLEKLKSNSLYGNVAPYVGERFLVASGRYATKYGRGITPTDTVSVYPVKLD